MSDAIGEAIGEALRRQASEYIEHPELQRAVGHLLGRGKLFRPRLALATFESLTGEDPLPYASIAAPLELIHTFTLIHDDLPCMDDAELRRGVRTVHLEFGEATAVLAGDSLCVLAVQVLLNESSVRCLYQRNSGSDSHVIYQTPTLSLVKSLTEATQAVVAGQVMDLQSEHRTLSLEELEKLHQKKTGALLGAACEFGALLAGFELPEQLRKIGEQTGLLFQIRDDLLSATGTEAEVGKTLSTDELKGKNTFVRLLGIEGAERYAEQLLHSILLSIETIGVASEEPLRAFVNFAYHRSN